MSESIDSSIDALPPLREVIDSHDLRAKKSLGQNFLLDLNLTEKIVRKAGNLAGTVAVEIGPGPGGLTRALLKSEAKKVYALEFDFRAIEALQSLEQASEGKLNLIQADALKTDIFKIAPEEKKSVVANLPYNIATPLLLTWLEQLYIAPEKISSMTLMFQKEVAERITAAPDTKAYGRLSIISQWLCDCQIVMTLPPGAFTPPPKISSCVVHFRPRHLKDNQKPDFNTVEKITASAFGQRRKMVRSSLKDYAQFFEIVGINPEARAETLNIQTFIDLAMQLDTLHQGTDKIR